MNKNYRLTIKVKSSSYWIALPEGFTLEINQIDGVELSGHPISIKGCVSRDGGTITTFLDFNGGSSLKRVTKTRLKNLVSTRKK